jgi:hypothetical protein
MYASLFGILGALHLDVFEQPEHQVFFSKLLIKEERLEVKRERMFPLSFILGFQL